MSNEIRRKMTKMTKANPGRTQEGDSKCTTTQFAVFFIKKKTCIFCRFCVTDYVK